MIPPLHAHWNEKAFSLSHIIMVSQIIAWTSKPSLHQKKKKRIKQKLVTILLSYNSTLETILLSVVFICRTVFLLDCQPLKTK